MFDARRFLRLAVAEWTENRRAWAWFFGVLVMLQVVVVVLILATGKTGVLDYDANTQAALCFAGMFITAPVFAGRYFQAMSRPGSALVALMRPASALEKWLLALGVIAIAYPLTYLLVFLVVNAPFALAVQAQAAQALAAMPMPRPGVEDTLTSMRFALESWHFTPLHEKFLPIDWSAVCAMGLSLLTLQGFAVFGSLWFQRMPFLKTLLAAFLVLLALMLATAVFGGHGNKLFDYWNDVGSAPPLATLPAVVYPLAWLGVPALLWVAALLALREREVA